MEVEKMKVNGTGTGSARDVNGASGTSEVTGAKDRRSRRTQEVDSGVSDKVALSGRGKDAAKAKGIANATPDVDEAKVARLKAAIQSGSYKVDADKVADSLVDEHLLSAY
jgi:negative regulator of flagellin synthesis FlgM